MKRLLPGAYELDDDRDRIDREAVHRFLSNEAYWSLGRERTLMDELIESAARVVGLYHCGVQIGFARVVSDGHTVAYLADVYVLEQHRGRGLGAELVRAAVEEGELSAVRKWMLHTRDAHDLYRRFGFTEPDARFLERWG